MRERPIAFTGEMVRAILRDQKMQTRRVVKFKPLEAGLNLQFSGLAAGQYCTGVPASGFVLYSRDGSGTWNQRTSILHSPFGYAGDRLWIREGIRRVQDSEGSTPMAVYDADRLPVGGCSSPLHWNWKTSFITARYMARIHSRTILEVSDVRVQRVMQITEEDAVAEGCAFDGQYFSGGLHPKKGTRKVFPTARDAFRDLWDSINGERPACSWNDNPWVCAVTFRRLDEKANST